MRKFVFCALTLIWSLQGAAIPVEGHKIMISAPTAFAIEVGRQVAKEGGNLADVAVAIGLTISVTTPYYAALGGGGFAVIKMNHQKAEALDFREVGTHAMTRYYYLKLPPKSSIDGGHSIGVPGFAAGLWALHQKYGKMKWSKLFAMPLKLARQGFAVSGEWTDKVNGNRSRFSTAGREIFFKKDGASYKPGEIFRQPRLAQMLQRFRRLGPKGFYQGPVAQDLVTSVHRAGGELSLADLKNYKVRWLDPLVTHFEGYQIDLMPPPSSGGIVIDTALQLINKLNLEKYAFLSVDELHLLGEIESRAFRGRALLGDPDFHKNPIAYLTSKKYVAAMAKTIRLDKATTLPSLTEKDIPKKEETETTNFSILDADGDAIALTVTLNGAFGSGVISSKYGIALNDEMDDFTTHPGKPNMFGLVQGEGNSVEPGKRPLSSMSPTLVEKDDKAMMSVGAPGGPRIITGVLQALYRTLAQNFDVDTAVQAPRVHDQFLPHVLYVDKNRLSPEVLAALRQRGHNVEEGWMAKVYIVRRMPNGVLAAAYDSRGEGAAGGF